MNLLKRIFGKKAQHCQVDEPVSNYVEEALDTDGYLDHEANYELGEYLSEILFKLPAAEIEEILEYKFKLPVSLSRIEQRSSNSKRSCFDISVTVGDVINIVELDFTFTERACDALELLERALTIDGGRGSVEMIKFSIGEDGCKSSYRLTEETLMIGCATIHHKLDILTTMKMKGR